MSDKSKIEWTDATWTPIRARCWEIQDDGSGKERIGWHCEHASEGCRNCYAEKLNLRLGTGYEFKPGNLRGRPGYYGGGIDRPELFLDEKMLLAPLRWKRPRKIFVCSMTDPFADFVADEWLDKMFAVMALCPQHTFQVLTKRAERMRRYVTECGQQLGRQSEIRAEIKRITPFPADRFGDHLETTAAIIRVSGAREAGSWQPLPNVWLGVSCERQQEADERIPPLLQTPAAKRFISAEPLLGPIDLHRIGGRLNWIDALRGERGAPELAGSLSLPKCAALDWIIVGGESGPCARPFNVAWADSILEQCKTAGVACFVKQLGASPLSDGYPMHLKSKKGGDWSEWPERLRVREFPKVPA